MKKKEKQIKEEKEYIKGREFEKVYLYQQKYGSREKNSDEWSVV